MFRAIAWQEESLGEDHVDEAPDGVRDAIWCYVKDAKGLLVLVAGRLQSEQENKCSQHESHEHTAMTESRTASFFWASLQALHITVHHAIKDALGIHTSSITCCPAMIRLVEVPMRVQVPPSVAENAMGMSTFFTGTPDLRAQAIRMGVIKATIGVLFLHGQTEKFKVLDSTSTVLVCPDFSPSTSCSLPLSLPLSHANLPRTGMLQ